MKIEDVLREMREYGADGGSGYNPDIVYVWASVIEAAMREKDAEIEDKKSSLDMMRSRLGERETLLRQCREKNKRLEARAALAGNK